MPEAISKVVIWRTKLVNGDEHINMGELMFDEKNIRSFIMTVPLKMFNRLFKRPPSFIKDLVINGPPVTAELSIKLIKNKESDV